MKSIESIISCLKTLRKLPKEKHLKLKKSEKREY